MTVAPAVAIWQLSLSPYNFPLTIRGFFCKIILIGMAFAKGKMLQLTLIFAKRNAYI
jgi:hypothetical protein